jgi:hypothetical protein
VADFEEPCRAHPAADAHGYHHVLRAAPLAFDQNVPHLKKKTRKKAGKS